MYDIAPRVDQIEARRVLAGWTYSELAARMRVSQPTVSRVLRGHVAPSRAFIGGVIAAFNAAGFDAEFADLFELRRVRKTPRKAVAV